MKSEKNVSLEASSGLYLPCGQASLSIKMGMVIWFYRAFCSDSAQFPRTVSGLLSRPVYSSFYHSEYPEILSLRMAGSLRQTKYFLHVHGSARFLIHDCLALPCLWKSLPLGNRLPNTPSLN